MCPSSRPAQDPSQNLSGSEATQTQDNSPCAESQCERCYHTPAPRPRLDPELDPLAQDPDPPAEGMGKSLKGSLLPVTSHYISYPNRLTEHGQGVDFIRVKWSAAGRRGGGGSRGRDRRAGTPAAPLPAPVTTAAQDPSILHRLNEYLACLGHRTPHFPSECWGCRTPQDAPGSDGAPFPAPGGTGIC